MSSEGRDTMPPGLLLRFFRWFCRRDYVEDIEGDLQERFASYGRDHSRFKTNVRFGWEVLRLLRPGIVRPIFQTQKRNNYGMLKNNFKVAWRSMLRQKGFTSIKVGGFAIGIAACLLITLFIQDELSYDRHFADQERIYRLTLKFDLPVFTGHGAYTQAPLIKILADEFPEIEKAGRLNISTLFGAGSNEISTPKRKGSSHEENVAFADQELLDVLQLSIVEGNPRNLLDRPYTLVIAESKARKYFPDQSAVGETLIFNGDKENPYTITGVMEDVPSNSHFNIEFFLSLKDREFWPGEQTNWASTNYFTYIKLRSQSDPKLVEEKLHQVVTTHALPAFQQAGVADTDLHAHALQYQLQPIRDIHLRSDQVYDGMVHGNIQIVRLFGLIAIMILVIACINFINLATAKSANRAKEVGLRKTMGSAKGQLISQFLVESVLLTVTSFIIGLALAWFAMPFFNALTAKTLDFPWQSWWFLPVMAMAALVVGLLSGLYPSLYLSAFNPMEVMKGKVSRGTKNSRLRNVLVVFQFATAIVLIFGTVVVNRQVNFMLSQDPGFKKDQVILINGAYPIGDQIEAFKNELQGMADIQSVSVTDYLPILGDGSKRNGTIVWPAELSSEEHNAATEFWRVDEHYIRTLGMTIAEGSDFDGKKANNRGKVIINETLRQALAFDQPIGRRLSTGDDTYEVIGVVEDFHFASFKEKIRGMCLVVNQDPSERSSIVVLKAGSDDFGELMTEVEQVWQSFVSDQSLRYTFLDQRFASMYEDVRRTEGIVSSFSLLAVMVACLGLFGLAAFIAEQRSKEMSIRKVLGASVQRIFKLLTTDFLKLICIAMVIGMPLSWFLVDEWLSGFSYRIDMVWWFFALAAGMTMLIALLTISRQALKVAFENPAIALKNE